VKKLYKFSGIIAVMAVWVSIISSIIIADLNIFADTPISDLGVDLRTRYLFISGLLISAVAFSTFAIRTHLILKTSLLAPIVLIAGQVSQVIVAATPYNAVTYIKMLHLVAAYTLAFSMPITMGLYAFTAKNKLLNRLNRRFFFAELLLFTFGLSWFIFAPNAGALSEILVGITFDIWVLTLSFKLFNVKR
jgi:hypothetical protein